MNALEAATTYIFKGAKLTIKEVRIKLACTVVSVSGSKLV